MEIFVKTTRRFFVHDQSQVSAARRSAVEEARGMGFGEQESAKIAVVVTEAGTNLLKHAGGGELLLTGTNQDAGCSLDILAIDRGPGMADLERSLQDGYSTVGSPGTGLGAMFRLCSCFRVYSEMSKGTVILCRFLDSKAREPPAGGSPFALAVSGVSVAMKGEEVSGDRWAVDSTGTSATLLVVDGLGHGPLAADAAAKAEEIFGANSKLEPENLLNRIHHALRSTRGAAVATIRLDANERTVTFAGIGNIAGAVLSPGEVRQMVCLPGIAGHEVRTIRRFVYPWPDGALVALASDGMSSQWPLRQYDALLREDPALIAGVLYRDFSRGHDDATVVIAGELGN